MSGFKINKIRLQKAFNLEINNKNMIISERGSANGTKT